MKESNPPKLVEPLRPSSPDEQFDTLLAEYLVRIDHGETPDMEALRERFPGAAGELQDLIEMEVVLQQIGKASHFSPERARSGSTADAAESQNTVVDSAPRADIDPLTAVAVKTHGGLRFGRYFLLGVLGRGSMGAVHLAYDTSLERFIALKTPRLSGDQSPASIERFRREARASATVRHPNICPIFDVGCHQGIQFLSMAYIEGQTLDALLQGNRPLPLSQSLQIIRQLAEALHAAHSQAVIHRDLKPTNIMIDASGNAIITDFGLARRLDVCETLLTQSGMLVGTLAYMSPEQLEGNPESVGRASDIYSLGVIFYQLLTGQLPYCGGFLSTILQIRAGRPLPPAQVCPELSNRQEISDLCLKMMAVRQEDRFASMAEVIVALRLPATEAVPLPPPPPAASVELVPFSAPDDSSGLGGSPPWMRRTIGGLSMLALAMLLAVALASARNDNPGKAAGGGDVSAAGIPVADAVSDAPEISPAKSEQVTRSNTVAPEDAANEIASKVGALNVAPVVHNADQAEQTPAPAPNTPPAQAKIATRVAHSAPFHIVELAIDLPSDADRQFRPDWGCRISSSSGPVYYPAYIMNGEEAIRKSLYEGAPADNTARIRGELRRVTAYFLTTSRDTFAVDVCYGGRAVLLNHPIESGISNAAADELLRAWWEAYNAPSPEPLNHETRLLKIYFQEMLARRLKLLKPAPPPATPTAISSLQHNFERSVDTFLGFASVKSALGEFDTWSRSDKEPLSHPLPVSPRIPALAIPPFTSPGPVESIASHVPDDCIYLHCRSVENYFWFRNLLLGWGGGLDEIVSPRRLDRQIRERLERQLALTTNENARIALEPALADLALIFGDTCFEDGAAVGVIFQAKNPTILNAFLKSRRSQALREFKAEGASEHSVMIAGHDVSLISTGDKRLLSYHVVSGRFQLVTNSSYLTRRFLEAGSGKKSLLNLKEFQYARSKVRLHDAQDVFLYMPDPFFARIIGPRHQVESARRQVAKADIQHLEIARRAAAGENRKAARLQDLKDAGFLPSAFGARSDGTSVVLKQSAEDSHRGVPGTFLPICDMDVTALTASEVRNYYDFSRRYEREYRVMDPVAVVVSHHPGPEGRQVVNLEIAITPYAQETYASVRRVLGPSQRKRIVGPPGELIRLQGSMKTLNGQPFLALAAVHDAKLDFCLVDGALKEADRNSEIAFASNHWMLAFDRLDPECLDSLLTIAEEAGITGKSSQVASAIFSAIGHSIAARHPLNFIFGGLPRVDLPVARGIGWKVRSPRSDLSNAKFNLEEVADDKQVRFVLNSLQGSEIEPYIQAYTFIAARKESAAQAHLFEFAMQQLNLAPENVQPALTQIHSTKFLCPLDGQWAFVPSAESDARNSWRSDRWTQASLYDETAVPDFYHFPFTDWLRGLNIGFSLKGQTLSADVHVEVVPQKGLDSERQK